MGTEGARVRRSLWDERFAHDSTKVGQFPIAEELPVNIARTLDNLATERAQHLPVALLATNVPSRANLDSARRDAERLRAQMIAWQEELDWLAYRIYGVLDEAITYGGEPPAVRFGERAFEIVLARQCADGAGPEHVLVDGSDEQRDDAGGEAHRGESGPELYGREHV